MVIAAVFAGGPRIYAAGPEQDRVRTEIPYRDGTVLLVSDFQERLTKTRYRARGHVEITYQDVHITAEDLEYDEATREGLTRGTTRFSQKQQWLICSRAEFNFSNQTGTFYDASGFTDQEFMVRGRTVVKTGSDTYRVEEGLITACPEAVPKWSFKMHRAAIRVDSTARLSHTVFKVKSIPVFYFPYVVVPLERKKRSSGFLPFHTGTSTSKGRVVSLGYFQTLGPSADVTFYSDYFTKRGPAFGGIFRARPNPQTRLYVLAYGIHDRLGQGGGHLVVDGLTSLTDNVRVVANVNVTTNFQFRQAFSDSFRAATVRQEHSILFMTRNESSYSTNFAFQREEVHFPAPERSLVIRTSPSLELLNLGQPLGKTPFRLSFRMAAEGFSRVDSVLESPKIVQRLDLFPRISVRLPSLAGFSLAPSIGFRQTYYSARVQQEPDPEIVPRSLHREYGIFELDIKTPTLEKTFHSSRLGTLKHVVEPVITYRRIWGVEDLSQVIRFDENDAVADTNEVEYGIVNRIYRSRETSPGIRQQFELLSLTLSQKYYFDPDFGGAFRPGQPNMFYPLNTLTGFSLTGIQRMLAPASMVFRLSPAAGVSYDARADFDTKLQRLRDASLSTVWQRKKVFVAGTYFKTLALEPGSFESHHIQGQAGYGSPSRGLSASITLSYNILTAQLLNSQSRLNYAWDCCGLAMEFQQFDLGLRTETRFSFSFTLKGIGSFGNVRRPESLF